MRKNILLTMLSTLIAFAIAELGLRIVYPETSQQAKKNWVQVPEHIWVEYHPILGWYPQKNKTAVLEDSSFPTVHIHTNSAGTRGVREYPLEKPKGMTRIAALGDSLVFGFGVQDHETFSAVLEARDKSLEVMNFGVPGYGYDQISLCYQTIAYHYKPDIVLIGIFIMDFWRSTRAFADSGHSKPYFSLNKKGILALHNVPVPPPFSIQKSQFPSLFEENIFEKVLNRSMLYRKLRRLILNFAGNLGWGDPENSDEWRIGKAILLQLVQAIRRDGARPVFLILPSADETLLNRREPITNAYLRFAEREGVDVINLMPVFRLPNPKQGAFDNFIKWDWHWNPKGHILAADMIQQYLAGLNREKESDQTQMLARKGLSDAGM